ncbi:MAG: fimbria/pilus periplasmic chaperone [Alphaproteobacteria bacterium]|nr:fimbria/pilus periplasmic chaperone [Alphaproteobacteria bacterium]
MKEVIFSRIFVFLLVLVLGTIPVRPAVANISLDKVILRFDPNVRPINNINVTNQGDKPVKVSIVTIEMVNSGQDGEIEKKTKNLIVAPKAFEMQPGETRAVRVVLRQYAEDMESIYRIRFKPSQPSFIKKEKVAGKSINVSIVLTMGALVIVPPKSPRPDLQFVRDGKIIHFTNKGNVTAQLQRDDFCVDEEKKTCVQLPNKRIYPGMTWDMDVPAELAGIGFSQTVLTNGSYSKISYPSK